MERTWNLRRILAAVAVSGMVTGAVLAQKQNPQAPRAPVVGADRETWNATVVSLDFPGGKASDYVETVRRAAGETPVNVTFSGTAGNSVVPPVAFRGVQLEAALCAIMQLQGPAHEERLLVQEVSVPQPGGSLKLGAPMFVVSMESAKGRSIQKDRVISLNRVVSRGADSLPAEVVLSAIETAFKNGGATVEMKFHKDSGLLFVSGTGDECELASEVVSQLAQDVDRRAGRDTKVATTEVHLAHVPATTLIDAIRIAFPSRPDEPEAISVAAKPETNSVVLRGTEPFLVAARAVARLADVKPETNPAFIEARAAEAEARRRYESVAREAEVARAELSKHQDVENRSRVQAEMERVRAEAASSQLDEARKRLEETRAQLERQLADCHKQSRERADMADSMRREAEALRDKLKQLEAEKEAAKPR